MKVHKTTFCLTSSLYGEKLSNYTLDEKSLSIYWMGGWVAPDARSGAEKKKKKAVFFRKRTARPRRFAP
jgi:outer membrane scaffolding protein for murein synthesis (MipA/OmpV family)